MTPGTVLLVFLLAFSVTLNVVLVAFAIWQHALIKAAADELGVKL